MELKERTNITSHIQFLIQLLNHNRHHYQYHSLTPYHQCREHEIYFLGLGSLLIYSPPGTADLGSVAGTVTETVAETVTETETVAQTVAGTGTETVAQLWLGL